MAVDQALKSISQKEAVRTVLVNAKLNTPNQHLIERIRREFGIAITPSKFSVYKSEINREKKMQDIADEREQAALQLALNLDNKIKNDVQEQKKEEEKKELLSLEKAVELSNKIQTQYPGGWEAFINNMDALEGYIQYMDGHFYKLRDMVNWIRKLKG